MGTDRELIPVVRDRLQRRTHSGHENIVFRENSPSSTKQGLVNRLTGRGENKESDLGGDVFGLYFNL